MAMIETVNLTKKYGDLVALDNLNLEINAGDCYGFIGPNGAGKTTTSRSSPPCSSRPGRRRGSARTSSATRTT